MMTPLFTVGIPVYNGMPFLPEAVDSILSQSFDDYELLVINDGSTDGSWEYLKSLRSPRLRLISQENRGLTATLNRMLEEASSRWLVRLDADDVACPDRLELVAEYVNRRPESGMFYSRARLHQHARAVFLTRSTEATPSELRAQTQMGYLLSICHSSVVLNVQKTLSLGGYRFNLQIEDLDLWWRMALTHDMVFIPEITVAYRLNAGSICATNLGELECHTLFAQYLLLSQLWEMEPLPYVQVQPVLRSFLDRRRLIYREHMWRAAILVSAQKFGRAACHIVVAACTAPRRFLRRALYPLHRPSMIRIGEPPQAFRKMRDQLWSSSPIPDYGQPRSAKGNNVISRR
jgi:glycosyltransferase involved in cell wall biosynthesis